jgi:hypothetical protein
MSDIEHARTRRSPARSAGLGSIRSFRSVWAAASASVRSRAVRKGPLNWLSLVLPAEIGRRCAGSLHFLQEPPRQLPPRQLFEAVVHRCMAEGLAGGEGFAVDASVIKADANRQRWVPGAEVCRPRRRAGRSTSIWLCWCCDAGLAGRSGVEVDRRHKSVAFFPHATNYLTAWLEQSAGPRPCPSHPSVGLRQLATRVK